MYLSFPFSPLSPFSSFPWGLFQLQIGLVSFSVAGFAALLSFCSLVFALLLARPTSVHWSCDDMFSEWTYELCRDGSNVTSELADDPETTPRDVIHRLFKPRNGLCGRCQRGERHRGIGQLDLQQAYLCGKWGANRPSDLFLQVWRTVEDQFNFFGRIVIIIIIIRRVFPPF